MASVNKVILLGNLGKDPDTRYTQGGDAVCNMRLATSESWKDKSGDKQERTEWHTIVVFGKLAEICAEYLKKGSKVYFEGSLQTRKWSDKDGVEKYSTEVKVDSFNGKMVMLDGPPGGRKSSDDDGETQQREPAKAKAPASTQSDLDDDIPF